MEIQLHLMFYSTQPISQETSLVVLLITPIPPDEIYAIEIKTQLIIVYLEIGEHGAGG